MRLTFLGTGTSMGVPVIGCECAVCTSPDPQNKRLRTSALLEADGRAILFDAGPDLRQQALAAGIRRVDAVLLTHAHADHIFGLDDLRPLNFAQRAAIPLYGTANTLAMVRERFGYAFVNSSEGSTRPALELVEIQSSVPFDIGTITIIPFDVQHGSWTITGFRIGRLGYVTDASSLPAASLAELRDLDVLVLNALRHAPHPTHFSLDEACAVVADLRPRQALLVHMTHDVEHASVDAGLPAPVHLAYDGQVVEIRDA
ncbi:beta-lactamase [Kouleothrix aurantiaca]|jgi:phosphoribosyl 1,2-cyclic phosphate phosphodiesterase|uniref:Beta-lactamase n=1 Tax=Kouleothrix aurantiaca TaxID=186479 RepID=A0A0P9DG26_9CHLR|nr:beta-lactamase [Kouleothrix aurantiaca]